MYLEERVKQLEEQNAELRSRLETLEKGGITRFVTVKELAGIMNCSIQNIHRKIRCGEIQVTRKLGDPRIPMNQFVDRGEVETVVKKRQTVPKKERSMAEQIFG